MLFSLGHGQRVIITDAGNTPVTESAVNTHAASVPYARTITEAMMCATGQLEVATS